MAASNRVQIYIIFFFVRSQPTGTPSPERRAIGSGPNKRRAASHQSHKDCQMLGFF